MLSFVQCSVYRANFGYMYYNFLIHMYLYSLFCCEFSGIFAYLNYSSPHTRQEIINVLITGLKRLEYRGYDSAGMNSHVTFSNKSENLLLLQQLCLFSTNFHGI